MVVVGGENGREERTFGYQIAESVWLRFTGMKLMELVKGSLR